MKILITGGAGFLGINMVRHLLNNGHDVTSLDIADFDYPEKNKIKEIKGDVRNRETVKSALDNVDMIIHTAMALPLYDEKEILTTGIDGTTILLEESFEKNIKRFVHISSTAVYGIPDHHPLYETDKLYGVGPYGKAKVEEEYLCESFREKGMIIPIIRPKSFIGPERLGVFALLYDWAYTGHGFPMIGKGDNRYQLLDVEDLCDAINSCLILNDNKVNYTFNIGAKEYTTMSEDYQAVLDFADHGKKIKGLPEMPIIWTLRLLEALNLSPLYKWVYETASKDSFVSIEKAEEKLDYKPKYSNKEALIRNYKWYLENLDSFQNQSGVSHRVPWKQGILSFAKLFF
ncbi:MAG: NAD-dependent epimerase/dehydratase family protein [Bacteroidetes bacterium]|nr:NAD-dependent epimerase/dehydratase family protein [Bacteroidota bacterium]